MNKINQKIIEVTKSEGFGKLMLGVSAVLFVLIIFQAGMLVGVRKAGFSYGYGEKYYAMFNERDQRPPHNPMERGLIDGHGTAGRIVSVSLPTFVVADQDNTEKVVLIAGDTVIRQFKGEATSTDLKSGDIVAVFGTPNSNSQIEAKLVRVLPSPRAQDFNNK